MNQKHATTPLIYIESELLKEIGRGEREKK